MQHGSGGASDGAIILCASPDESDEIARLFRLSREVAMPFLPVLHTPDEDRAFMRNRVFPTCEVWIARIEAIAGFIAYRDGWVDHLHIHPEFQRYGLGRKLLDQAKARFSQLQLWTFQKNTNAIAFYEKNGFQKLRITDGDGNEEREPDALFGWP